MSAIRDPLKTEILAPAGSPESLTAAVRCGADAVYLGGRAFNARRNAANFDDGGLASAVRYCHAADVKVYLTLNTLVTDRELEEMAAVVQSACGLGIDAVIVQDLSVAAFVRACAPSMPLHASTQMSVHNIEGVKALEALGFSRVVLSRELTEAEITEIRRHTAIGLECFVHGALCMSVSGQCYLSAMLGGRSGNRGLCAQPCRLPMASAGREYALSLKDLSLVQKIPDMLRAGVTSFKIEGRMKRPEYVAAAVSAVKAKLENREPDLEALRAVFSRDGFTSGYFDDQIDQSMFGARTHGDVTAASPAVLNALEALYKDERPRVPVTFSLLVKRGQPTFLSVSDGEHEVSVTGAIPEAAKTSPTTPEKAAASLGKTGGTLFSAAEIKCDIGDGLMLPASALNAMRRTALDALYNVRESLTSHTFVSDLQAFTFRSRKSKTPRLRIRLGRAGQLSEALMESAELVYIPATELARLDSAVIGKYAQKLVVETPRILFGAANAKRLGEMLDDAAQHGITHASAGNIGMIEPLRARGFTVHGDFSLNITNTAALNEYEALGLSDSTVSFELTHKQVAALRGEMKRGILAYGYLPLMVVRNCPAGNCKRCQSPHLTDRLGNRLPIRCAWGVSEICNCVPLFLADKLTDFSGVDFFTLYFTSESSAQCADILGMYLNQAKTEEPKTRGLYYRGVD